MSRSANEVMALATKAARGAGAPAGQAATFGRAVVCHLSARRPDFDIRDALDALPQGPIIEFSLALARVLGTDKRSGSIACTKTALAKSYCETLPFTHKVSATLEGIDLSIDISKPCPRAATRRLDLPDYLVTQMNDLAARILVPESDASRLGGAGAGLTDND